MKKHILTAPGLALLFLATAIITYSFGSETGIAVFNIKDFGATGKKTDSAQSAIQKAINACAGAEKEKLSGAHRSDVSLTSSAGQAQGMVFIF